MDPSLASNWYVAKNNIKLLILLLQLPSAEVCATTPDFIFHALELQPGSQRTVYQQSFWDGSEWIQSKLEYV